MSLNNVDLKKLSLLSSVILGDGHITPRGSISLHHSVIQESYAQYKAEFLNKNFGLTYKKNIQKLVENTKSFSTNDSIKYFFHVKNITKELRSYCYIGNEKNINKDLIEAYEGLHWSFIFQDDGRTNKVSHYNTIINNKRVRVNCEPFVNRYEICLGFPSEDMLNALINNLLKYNIESWILTRKDGQKNIAISRAQSKINFYNLIKDYVHPSMNYKINIKPTLNYSE